MSIFSKFKNVGQSLFVDPMKKVYEKTMGDPMTAITNIGGTIFSALSGERAAKRQIAWERERATHAHQWEVQDLINAGLNPILSAGGSGAVTGGISAPIPDVSGLQNSAAEAKRINNENKLATAEISKSNSQSQLNKVNAELGTLQKALTEEQTAATANQARKAAAEADLAEAELEAARPKLKTEKEYNESQTGQVLHLINQGWNDTGGAATTLAIGGLGGAKIATSIGTAKKAQQAAKSAEFAKKIMRDSGKITLPVIDPRNFK